MFSKVDVVLPCYNESGAIVNVLKNLPQDYQAILVDNNSTDDSAEKAMMLGADVVKENRQGFGAAVNSGVRAATAEYIAICDCDNSLNLNDLPQMLELIQSGEADLVLGRRRAVSHAAWPLMPRLANKTLSSVLRRLSGVQVYDMGPMRMMRRDMLLELDLKDRRSGYPLEMVLKASAKGYRIREVDVPYSTRTGKSKVTGTIKGFSTAVRDMLKVMYRMRRNSSSAATSPAD